MDQVKIFNNELSSLYESKPPISKAKMTQLTRSAIKGIKFYKHVVQSVEKFIQKCRPEYKVPGLYVIDSIVRQSRHQFGYDRDVFVPRFSKNIVATFQCLYKCPSEEKPKIVKVLNLWQKNNVFPTEIIQPLLDMANIESTDTKPIGDDSSFKPWTSTDGPSNNLQGTHNKETNEEAPVLNSAIISQLQELTSQLLNNPKMSDSQLKQENAVKFNKKLLDFDYGDEEEEPEEEEKEENGHAAPTEPTAIALSMAQNLLSNPELLKQLQQMQQTIQQTESLKTEQTLTERKEDEPQSSQQQQMGALQTQQQELHLQQQIHQQNPPLQLHQQAIFPADQLQPHQSMEVNFNHPKLTHQNFQDVTFPVAQNMHPDVSLPVSQPQMNMMGMGNPSHIYSPLFPPPQQSQNFSPGMIDQNYSVNQTIRNANRMGINSAVMDMEHSSLPENPSQLLHDQDERQMWGIHQKELDDRDRGKKDRSRSRSRSPRNRTKASRKHKRSRSRSPKRRRSLSRSPSRHRRDKRSDSRDYDRERDNDRDKDRDKDRDREKDKDRDRRKKGLPPLKKNHLAVCSTTLWLGHVPKMVPENELKDIFLEFGNVASVDLIPPRGCAYICMEKRQDAARSLNRLKNLKLQGNSLKMAWAPGKGVKGKEYKSYWDVEQGVTYIPYEKLPDKAKIPDLGEGGMIDEESVPDNLKDVLVIKEETAKSTPNEVVLAKDGESGEKGNSSGTSSAKDNKNHSQSSQQNQLTLKQSMTVPSMPTQQEQATMMAGTPIHMPLMATMPPPQFGLGLPGMVGPQQMLIPQIPLPMGVPPPNQIMMMNPGALMNPPPTMAMMQSAMAAASLQQPNLVNAVSGINIPPNNVGNEKTNDSDQMDENSDATPTEEDRMRSARGENENGDVDNVKTNTSLPSNFPSNPPNSIPFSSAFASNVSGGTLVVTSAPSMTAGHHLSLPVLTSHSQPWPPNPNGPGLFRMPPGALGMPQFNHMPPRNNSHPPLMNPNMPPPPFGHRGNHPNLIRPPPNSMGGNFGPPPSPNLPSPDGRNNKPLIKSNNNNNNNKQDEFDPKISANCVPLGRSRINFGSQSPQRQSPGVGPGSGPGPGMRMLGPPPLENRGPPPPRMGGPNPMRMPPPPQELGFRPQRPLISGLPNFGGQGPPPRFPFGRGQDGPMGPRAPPPFLMRGPHGPGMGHRMEFRGPLPPEFREDRFGPDFRGRPPFGPPPMDREPFFKGNDMRMERNADFPPDDRFRGPGDEMMMRGRRPPDSRRGFVPHPDERGFFPPDARMDGEEFGPPPRDHFEARGFEDRRRMMDRGRFNFGPGPRDWDRDFDRDNRRDTDRDNRRDTDRDNRRDTDRDNRREIDRDNRRDIDRDNRREIESESGRDGDRNRGRDRGDRSDRDRRDRRESRWNRSRSRSREPPGDSPSKNGVVQRVDEKDVLIIKDGPLPKKPIEVIDIEPMNEAPPMTNESVVDLNSGGACSSTSNCDKVPSENNTPVKDESSSPKEEAVAAAVI